MLKIDADLCIGCGVCEDTCIYDAIHVEDGIAIVNEKCTLCGTCVDNCEVEALSIPKGASPKVDISLYQGVWAYAEYRNDRIAPVSFELLGAGRKLADNKNVELAAKVTGLNFVVPKQAARTLVTTNGGDSVLSVWRFGLGRVVSLTTDDGNKWSGELLSQKNSKLITKSINWLTNPIDPLRL